MYSLLALLALLVRKYARGTASSRKTMRNSYRYSAYVRFTCFTSTKVLWRLDDGCVEKDEKLMHVLRLLALLVQKYSRGFMQTDEKLLQAVLCTVYLLYFTSTVY